MTSPLIDTHVHLDMASFDKDRAETIERARAAGVIRMINIGIDLDSSRKAIELADEHPDIFATVGFHPHDAARMKASDADLLAELARHPKVVAVGEMGLDFYRNISPTEVQVQAFGWQLDLADRLSLPVVIHCREAVNEMISILREWTANPCDGKPVGVIHCFSGDVSTLELYLEMGFHIALGAYIGYPASRGLGEMIRRIPADRLLLETDCPFLPPQAYRGQRNEPSYVTLTAEAAAAIRSTSPKNIAEETTRNATALFGLPDWQPS